MCKDLPVIARESNGKGNSHFGITGRRQTLSVRLKELNTLISGSTTGFDVKDLRANTVLSGGYQECTGPSEISILMAMPCLDRWIVRSWDLGSALCSL